MKKIQTILAVLGAVIPQICHAQANSYAEAVSYEFTAADAAALPGLPKTPLIAVPVKDAVDEQLFGEIVKNGGIPVAIPAGMTDFNGLREAATGIDGFVFTDALKEQTDTEAAGEDGASETPGLLLLKAMIDRNVPIMGSSDLLKEINAGLLRLDEDYPDMASFIARARLYKEAKMLMQRIFTIDTHNDQPCQYKRGGDAGLRQRTQVSLPKMTEGYLDASFFISWIAQGDLDEESTADAMARCEGIIDHINADAARYSDYCGIARNEDEAKALKVLGKKAIFIGVENGYGIGTDLSKIRSYRDKGMVYMTLCHTGDNAICHTSSENSKEPEKGLTKFGKKVVRELNDCGIMIDLSHANEATFWDAIKYSKAPIVCTHSGAKGVHDHNRNLTDDQLRALAQKGGVIQIYTVSSFMVPEGTGGTIDNTLVDHLMHCIEVAGIDHVGIGTDFDGGSGSRGLNGSNDLVNITMRLIEKGLSPEDIQKIWSGNFFRVMKEVQSMARK